jgi:hypothetical protein
MSAEKAIGALMSVVRRSRAGRRATSLRGTKLAGAIILALALGVLAEPLAVPAQHPAGKSPRIGFLGDVPPFFDEAFRQGCASWATSTVRTSRCLRELDPHQPPRERAPRDRLSRASRSRAVATWMVPTGMTSHVHAFDACEGGSFRIS